MKPSPDATFLKAFLLRHWRDPVISTGGRGIGLDFPSFDFGPFDYLEFADKALARKVASSRIDSVTHLKRAIECQMDVLIHVMHIPLGRTEQNFPFKLCLIERMGIVRSSSLGRLNTIRNKVEHRFLRPNLQNLEVYFDLASAFVTAVDGYIFKLAATGVVEWQGDSLFLHEGKPRVSIGTRASYSPEDRRAVFRLRDGNAERTVAFAVSDGWETFAFGVRVHHLLMQAGHIISTGYARRQLRHLRLPNRLQPKAPDRIARHRR